MSERKRHFDLGRWSSDIRVLKENDGFTLTEMLLVLFILTAVVGFTIPAYKVFYTEQEEKRFFDVLLQDIYFAQSESYKTKTSVLVVFHADATSYKIARNARDVILERQMPPSVSFKTSSNITNIYYNPEASIVNPGTLRFGTSEGEKTITVHLGKGRVVFSG